MSDCPTEATLERLEAGVLSELTFAGVEEHVESCAKCQSVLQVVVREDLRASGCTALPGGHDVPAVPGFIIERELGRGTNGVVFLARDGVLERHVALKMMRAVDPQQPDCRSPKLTEEQAVSRLRHPHIVHLYHRLDVGPWTVLVLEYVPGGSLKERLSGPLEPQLAAELLETVARAIGHVHKAGLLHLDIKPSNILVDGEPGARLETALLKVSDFGIALPFSGLPFSGEGFSGPRGTPSYMAPEQAGALAAAIGPAADVYGLGALLYHLLTGRPPFESPSARQTLELIGTAEPVSPRRLNPRIPRDLELICLHCLAKRPERRYESAEILADDLRRFLDGRRISVRAAASMEQVGRWCRRRPAIAALVVALALTLVASLSVLLFLLRRSEFNRREADAARWQAEENEALASRTLEEFEVWIQRILAEPRLLENGSLPSLIDDAELLTENLHRDGDSVLRMIATVGMLQRDVASKIRFRSDSGLEESTSLLARSRAYLTECLRQKPDSELLQEQYILTLLDCAHLASIRDDFPELESCVEEVAVLAPHARDRNLRIRSLIMVTTGRREAAFKHSVAGNYGFAHRVMAAAFEMLERLAPEDAAVPDVRMQRGFALSWLGRSEEAASVMRKLTGLPPSEWLRPGDVAGHFREWLAAPAVQGILWPEAAALRGPPDDLVAQSRLLLESVRERAKSIGVEEPDLAAVFGDFFHTIHLGCSVQRRWNTLGPQIDSARRFLAFAHEIARQYPERAEPQILISHAHHQLAKNAWHVDDDRAALASMHEAIAAAQRAEILDPDSAEAQRLVTDLAGRVAKSVRAE